MKMKYSKPSIIVTDYSAIDKINAMTRNVSAPIATKYIGSGSISVESYKLHY